MHAELHVTKKTTWRGGGVGDVVDIKLYCSFNFFRFDFIHSAANSSIALSCLSTMHSSEGKEIQTRNLAYSVVCRNWDLGTTGEMDKT